MATDPPMRLVTPEFSQVFIDGLLTHHEAIEGLTDSILDAFRWAREDKLRTLIERNVIQNGAGTAVILELCDRLYQEMEATDEA